MRLIPLAAGVCLVVALAAWLLWPRDTIGRLQSDALLGAATDHSTLDAAFAAAGLHATQICVFGPYSLDEGMAAELGFPWDGAAERTGILWSDSHNLVVLGTESEVVAWAMVPRDTGLGRLDVPAYGCRQMAQ